MQLWSSTIHTKSNTCNLVVTEIRVLKCKLTMHYETFSKCIVESGYNYQEKYWPESCKTLTRYIDLCINKRFIREMILGNLLALFNRGSGTTYQQNYPCWIVQIVIYDQKQENKITNIIYWGKKRKMIYGKSKL